jgi:hypothetical protein
MQKNAFSGLAALVLCRFGISGPNTGLWASQRKIKSPEAILFYTASPLTLRKKYQFLVCIETYSLETRFATGTLFYPGCSIANEQVPINIPPSIWRGL